MLGVVLASGAFCFAVWPPVDRSAPRTLEVTTIAAALALLAALESIYKTQSELLVVVLCADYERKEWCGLGWRVVRELIKVKASSRIMFVRPGRHADRGVAVDRRVSRYRGHE